jgi:hemerythrin
VVDEILKVDPKMGKALEAKMAQGVQAVEEMGEMVVVHYVDEDYVMQRLEIPRSEVAASAEVDLEKLKAAIAKRVDEVRARKARARKLEELRGFRAAKA